MLTYKDVITGEDLFSEMYPVNLVDDAVYEVGLITEDKNLVEEFNLQPINLDKRAIANRFNKFSKAVTKYLNASDSDSDAASRFQKGSLSYLKKILNELSRYNFYTGPSGNEEGMVIMVRDEETALVWKYGVQHHETE